MKHSIGREEVKKNREGYRKLRILKIIKIFLEDLFAPHFHVLCHRVSEEMPAKASWRFLLELFLFMTESVSRRLEDKEARSIILDCYSCCNDYKLYIILSSSDCDAYTELAKIAKFDIAFSSTLSKSFSLLCPLSPKEST